MTHQNYSIFQPENRKILHAQAKLNENEKLLPNQLIHQTSAKRHKNSKVYKLQTYLCPKCSLMDLLDFNSKHEQLRAI
jgi:hypothetical protein